MTLSCATAGATIRYTTNGSEPSSSSPVYSSAIPVSSMTTIKAKAFMGSMTASAVATATYTITITPTPEQDPDPTPTGQPILEGANGRWMPQTIKQKPPQHRLKRSSRFAGALHGQFEKASVLPLKKGNIAPPIRTYNKRSPNIWSFSCLSCFSIVSCHS